MPGERFLLDTFFVQALLNRRDQYHEKAKEFWPRVKTATEVWITEAVLVEIGNALSAANRQGASEFIGNIYVRPDANIRLAKVDTPLMQRALKLYTDRPDKTWGFTDCISFVVMEETDLQAAATGDSNFQQAGFLALLA